MIREGASSFLRTKGEGRVEGGNEGRKVELGGDEGGG